MYVIARIFTAAFRSKFGLIALGLVIAAFSFSFKPANPSCGNDRMNPGDACVNDVTNEIRTYEDMVEEERNELLASRFGGLALAAGGVVLYVVRRRKAAHAPGASTPLPAYAHLPAPPAAVLPASAAHAHLPAPPTATGAAVPTSSLLPPPPVAARPATMSAHGQAF